MIKRERHSAWHWLRKLPLIAVLRVMVPLYRVITGHPPRRYSEVLPSLWVGGQHYRHGIPKMRKQGITAIVNLRTYPDDAAMNRITERYLWLPTTDHTPPTLADIQRAVDFIDAEIANGGKVYVHCRAGVGRGPTMTACYLVSKNYTPHEAWEAIRRVRPFIYPTTSQLLQVESYYHSLQETTPAFETD
ncbi:MAG: protein phosphatase [Phototrophicales bacterium]|nr:MAG: protein phosphatase [Phototrophicales bacterium]